MLKIGDNLPHFSCHDDKGNLVTQEDFKGKNVILFFYPRAILLDVQHKHVICLKIMKD